MLRDVNRDPRRWVDGSGRVRVIEGWHPSEPDRVGYNLMVDGDWCGTFATLDDAAVEAAAHVDIVGEKAVLRPFPVARRSRAKSTASGLHLIESVPDED
jgi:hypothetical protein